MDNLRLHRKPWKRALVVFGISLASAAGVAFAEPTPLPAAQAPQAAPSRTFVITYRPGPRWVAGQPMAHQKLGPHLAYYRRGLAEGTVFAGGALPESEGGLAILTVSSLEQAQAFLAADPAILEGVFAGEVRLWVPTFVSPRPLPR